MLRKWYLWFWFLTFYSSLHCYSFICKIRE
jgi:hypothetical protein